MKKLGIFLLFILLISATVSCSSEEKFEALSAIMPPEVPAEEASGDAVGSRPMIGSGDDEGNSLSKSLEDLIDRMIVRSGTISLKVQDIPVALDRAQKIAELMGGFVVFSNWRGGEKENSATISIRVPAEKFAEAMESLRNMALEVISETTGAEDVTEEFTDLEAQLRNLEVTENRYLELIDRAESIEAILKIENILSQTRGRIEETKGRIQFLERSSATSLINILLVEESELTADFITNQIELEEGSGIWLTNQSAGGAAPYGYLWSFGDGKSSLERDPFHIYDEAGRYSVSLTVSDSKKNEATETKIEYIHVVAKPGWSPGDIVKSAWRGVVNVTSVLGALVIWIAVLAVFWIPILLVIYWLRRRKKRFSRR